MVVHYALENGYKGIGIAYDNDLTTVYYSGLVDRLYHLGVPVASTREIDKYRSKDLWLTVEEISVRDLRDLYNVYSWRTGKKK